MERLFTGSLNLFAILVAMFTFSVVEYRKEIGRPVTQELYQWLLLLSGLLTVACGVVALWAHLRLMPPQNRQLHWVFASVILATLATPIVVWFLLK
jgi:hypothetical protein